MEITELKDSELIARVLNGDSACFEVLVQRYSPRVFSTARRYARLESEVEDIVQEVWLKSYRKLGTYHGSAPFEHWLMRLTVRTCYDFLRKHQRNRESAFSELSSNERDWLETYAQEPGRTPEDEDAARQLVARVLEQMTPPARLIITLLEIEERSVKEIAELTGWSVALVKVRAFRARAQMKRILASYVNRGYL